MKKTKKLIGLTKGEQITSMLIAGILSNPKLYDSLPQDDINYDPDTSEMITDKEKNIICFARLLKNEILFELAQLLLNHTLK